MSNQFHHQPKKGSNKGIAAEKKARKRAEAEARNVAYQEKMRESGDD
jgi:hypothetical protein